MSASKEQEAASLPSKLPPFDHSKVNPDSFILGIGKRRYGVTKFLDLLLG
jgi:hypothetical protein